MIKFYFALLPLFLFGCKEEQTISRYEGNNPAIAYQGRVLPGQNNQQVLSGSASYAEFIFTGDSCIVFLKNISQPGDYNYIAVELDSVYTGRFKVDGDTLKPYTIRASIKSSAHLLRLYKATESHNGQVALAAVEAGSIKKTDHPVRKKIEFIGNSITAGMGNDTKEIPCDANKWYDQHNAYWAYGPRVARTLNADFMVSAVSGIGIYRNWNSDGPTMPQVYESAYLMADSVQRWDFSRYTPDVVSICLGTNDFSDGDGTTLRKAFDATLYIKNYTDFIGILYSHYPAVQIALLTSPMLSGNKSDVLFACLESVRRKCKELYPGQPGIELFRFQPMIPKGCGYHPDIADHAILAGELVPFFERLLKKG